MTGDRGHHYIGNGVVLILADRAIWLDMDQCVVDDDDVCQRGDHPVPGSLCNEKDGRE